MRLDGIGVRVRVRCRVRVSVVGVRLDWAGVWCDRVVGVGLDGGGGILRT